MQWRRLSTLGALCAVSMIKGADLQLLPTSFRAMEVDLGLKPYALGALALFQGVGCAATGPFWGNLVDSGFPRKRLLMVGAGAWGFCTLVLAFVSNFSLMALFRACNGAAIAMLLPVVQTFVVELSEKGERGYIFGCLFFFSNLGQVLACLFVTPISTKQISGADGWRVATAVVGLASWLVVALVALLVEEEPRSWRPERFGLAQELRKITRFMKVPTFAVIIAQGLFGTIPGAALAFSTMYFQYTGLSDSLCALVNSLRIIGDACGGLIGGLVGDLLHSASPKYGRAVTAQISIVASLPLVYMIFMGTPRVESMAGTYGGLLFLHGLVGSWVAPGCICPIMCDIVPRRSLASAYAWELALVFCSGNTLGPVLVGVLSQKIFGYKLSTQQVQDMEIAARRDNARALGQSLFFSSAFPYACCAVLFSLLYWTYARDARTATESDGSDSSPSSSAEGSEPPRPTAHTKLLVARPDAKHEA